VAQVDEFTATRPLRPVNLANGPSVLLNIVDTGTMTTGQERRELLCWAEADTGVRVCVCACMVVGWNEAGEEKHSNRLTATYFRNVHALILVYSVAKAKSADQYVCLRFTVVRCVELHCVRSGFMCIRVSSSRERASACVPGIICGKRS
jgi:hypothetical protein